jgi:hypothetical protein
VEATDETDWLEWKCPPELTESTARGHLARNILGMANRHPDHAKRFTEGYGYVVVGTEPGNVVGVPRQILPSSRHGLRLTLARPDRNGAPPTWMLMARRC